MSQKFSFRFRPIPLEATVLAGLEADGAQNLILTTGGYPDATNTGPTTSLTPVSGDRNITVAGTTISGELRTGSYHVNASNVTIRDCKIINGSVNQSGSHTGLLVEDCEFDHEGLGEAGCIGSQNYTARRCNFHGGENVVWAQANVVIEDCFIHHPVPYNPETDPHTDGIQMPSTSHDIVIQHNTIYGDWRDNGPIGFGNSAITMGGFLSNLLIHNNLLAGGGYTLRMPGEGGSTNVVITNNRFSTIFTESVGGFGPEDGNRGNVTTFTGNVFHETGLPV